MPPSTMNFTGLNSRASDYRSPPWRNWKTFRSLQKLTWSAYGYSCESQTGIHVNEEEFIAEVINPETGNPVAEGEKGELVLTNLGRYGYPNIRYRTHDVVIKDTTLCSCGNPHLLLPGGIIGRTDDMMVVRGVNIFPAAIEAIIREFREI